MTDPIDETVAWESYELQPPRIHLQRIRNQADLEQLQITLEMNGTQGGGVSYSRQGWRGEFEYAVTTDPYFKDGKLYANSYHSGYGDSVDTRSHYVAGIGTCIAVNLNTSEAVFIDKMGDRPLQARDLPASMLTAVLHRIEE